MKRRKVTTTAPPAQARAQPPRNAALRPLLMVLGLAVVALAALLPWIRAVNRETERIERETAAKMAEASQAKTARTEMERARAEAAASPTSAPAQMRLAALASAAGDLEQARAAAESAARLNPRSPDSLLLLADIHHRARRYGQAISAYRAVLRDFPDNPQAYAGLGWMYISLGWAIDARDLMEKAVKAHPNNPRLRAGLALACLQHDDFDASERQLRKVKELAPTDALQWAPLVDLFLRTNRAKEAVDTAAEALRIVPDEKRLLYGLGRGQYDGGDIPAATRTFERLVAADPENAPARYRLALCYKRANRMAEAQRELERVYAAVKGYEQTMLLLGQMYVQSGRAEEGRKLLTDYQKQLAEGQKRERVSLVVSMNPRSADAHAKMAEVYREGGDISRMTAELWRAADLAPNRRDLQEKLSAALAERDRVKR